MGMNPSNALEDGVMVANEELGGQLEDCAELLDERDSTKVKGDAERLANGPTAVEGWSRVTASMGVTINDALEVGKWSALCYAPWWC